MTDRHNPPQQASVAVATPDRMALLHTMVFTALRLSAAQFDAFSTRLLTALSSSEQAAKPTEAERYRHASTHLQQHRATFHRLAAECLQHALLQATQSAGTQGDSRLESGALDLSLSTFEAMERKVLLDNLSQALDVASGEALAVLGMRIAHWLQSENISADRNPFRSEVFLRGISDAWSKFDSNPGSHCLVLQQLRPDVFLPLGSILQALNQELAIRNILPDAEQEYRDKQSQPAPAVAPPRQDKPRPRLPLNGMPNISDARAVELLDKAFEPLLRDESIASAVRELLGRLQLPLLELALADKESFFRAQHPGQRLVDAVLNAGFACDPGQGRADPLFLAIAHIVDRIESERQAGCFDEVIAELDTLVGQLESKAAAKLHQAIAEATAQENMSHAQQLAESDVNSRLETGEVPGFIESFLQIQWSRVLAFAYSVRDTKPEVLPNVLKAMDDLVCSTKPKSGPEERKDLVECLPGLLSMLNAWLNVIKWTGPERDAFFSALAERHAAAMRGPVELTPRHRLELTMNMVQKASEHQLTRRALQQQVEASAEFMRSVDTLEQGSWLEFVRNNGSKVNCKLAWVSPRGSRFIFVGRQGQLIFTLTDEALVQAIRTERARTLVTRGVIGRALAAALEETAGN